MDPSVVLIALGAALCFGLALVLTQPGLRHAGPLEGACVAIPVAAAMFLLLAPLTVDFAGFRSEGAVIFALIGCLFPATVTILTFYANRRIGPNLTGSLGNLAPLFAVGLGVMVLGETPGWGEAAGLAVIVAGVVLLYRAPGAGQGRQLAAGIGWAFLIPLAAAFVRGLVQPMVKTGLAEWPSPFAAVTLGYLVSAVLVVAVVAIRRRGWPWPRSRAGVAWFAAVGMVNGMAVFGLYQALALGTVTLVAPLVACYPLATLALSVAFMKSARVGPATLAGIALTVAGVAVLLAA